MVGGPCDVLELDGYGGISEMHLSGLVSSTFKNVLQNRVTNIVKLCKLCFLQYMDDYIANYITKVAARKTTKNNKLSKSKRNVVNHNVYSIWLFQQDRLNLQEIFS